MRKIIIILICLISIDIYPITYENNQINNGYQNYHISNTSYFIPFRSTSSYNQTIHYQTVKSLNNDGSVSENYTTYKNRPKNPHIKRGLDLDDDDEPVASATPLEDDQICLMFLLLSYAIYKKIKNRKEVIFL